MRTELSNVRVQNSFARAEISELRSKNARCGAPSKLTCAALISSVREEFYY